MIYQALIVDDEEIVCRGLAQFVKWKEHNFEVAGTAYSVDEAVSLLEKMHIDVVFSDIRMPEKDGLILLQEVKEHYPETKAVILSGHSDFTYAKEAIRLEAVDYLTKPVNIGEMEALLDRLSADFDREREKAQIHTNRMEALLLSAAKGLADVNAEKYHFPVLENWYGVGMALHDKELSEEVMQKRKEQMKIQITAVVSDAILIDSSVYSLFAMLPYRSESEADTLIGILDQLCQTSREWICGISKYKTGIGQLPEAWKEANQALRYYRASGKSGVVLYKNIELLFADNFPEIPDFLGELFQKLSNPETREQTLPWLSDSFSTMSQSTPTVTEFQTLCIRCLIELNSFLQGLEQGLQEFPCKLNEELGRILQCDDKESTIRCVTEYIGWIVEVLGQSDDKQMGKGVIREIQLYIRSHYEENITLNMLAEQFFLHPNYLSRLFKTKTGKNFVEYLTEVRMEKVKELLRNTDYKIIEICSMTGYDNPRYFSKIFKQFTGMTPREFRDRKAE